MPGRQETMTASRIRIFSKPACRRPSKRGSATSGAASGDSWAGEACACIWAAIASSHNCQLSMRQVFSPSARLRSSHRMVARWARAITRTQYCSRLIDRHYKTHHKEFQKRNIPTAPYAWVRGVSIKDMEIEASDFYNRTKQFKPT